MDFDLSEEQRIFQKAIRDFSEKEIAPLVEEAEEEERFPLKLFPRMGRLGTGVFKLFPPSLPPLLHRRQNHRRHRPL